jgi:hypothetical protein
VSTIGEVSDPHRTDDGEGTSAVLVGAAAEVVLMVVRACSQFGTASWKLATTTGKGILLVPVIGSAARDLDRRWRSDREGLESRGRSLFEVVAGRTLDGVLASIDLTSLVLRNVDIDRIVEQMDIQRVIDRVDIDAAVEKADVVGIARYVIEELDLPGIIRESSGTLATDTIEGLRIQGMNADSSLSRFIDRLLGRRDGDARGGGAQPSEDGRTAAHLGEPHRADA